MVLGVGKYHVAMLRIAAQSVSRRTNFSLDRIKNPVVQRSLQD
jgi:hypothetical protein